MKLEAEVARRSVIGAARGEISLAAGPDGLVSKPDQKKLAPDLSSAADRARESKGRGAGISVDDVVDAYALHVTRSMREVNQRGPKWLSMAETRAVRDPALRDRLLTARAEALGGAGALLSEAKLVEMTAKFVKENSEPELGGDTGKIFPHVEDAEEGLHAFLMSGAASVRLAEFAKVWFGDGHPELERFDPKTQTVLAVQRTQDEESLFVSIVDKRSGRVSHSGEMGVVDLPYTMDQATFERIMGPVSRFGVESIDDLDHYDVIEALVKGGTPLDIGNPNDH